MDPTIVNQLVDEWFAKHFHSRGPSLDVTAYNIAYAAKEDLKIQLAALAEE